MTEEKPKPKPAFTVRAGAVKATVWANEVESNGQKFTVHNTDIVRTYKDGEQWKETNQYRKNDLPKVALVAQKCFEFLTVGKTD